ncbi:MAG: hypothetical protein R3244_03665 [Thermoanaerobaculia bacterium]|nr:hypothetical protein [Thermoanaerobaculia bacterium]
MTAFTDEMVEQYASKMIEKIGPTLELQDLQVVVPAAMEIVDIVSGMDNEDRHQTVLNMLKYVLDNTDTPWRPDAASDPLFLNIADVLLIPLIAKASKGEFKINENKSV